MCRVFNRIISHAVRLIVALTICTAVIAPVPASPITEVDYDQFKEGFLLLQTGQLTKAAREWLILSQTRATQSDPLSGALAAMLAALAFERSDDSTAYAAWGQAIQLFLQSGTTWELSRQAFSSHYTKTRRLLAQNSGTQVTPSPSILTMIALEEALSISTYDGPKSNLNKAVQDTTKDRVTVSKNFYARPLSLVESSSTAEGDNNRQRISDAPVDIEKPKPIAGGRTISPINRQTTASKPEQRTSPSEAPSFVPARGTAAFSGQTAETPKTNDATPPNSRRTLEPVLSDTQSQPPIQEKQESSVEAITRLIARSNQTDTTQNTTNTEDPDTTANLQRGRSSETSSAVAPRDSVLTSQDMQVAKNAWQYFKKNRYPVTGFVSSTYGYDRGTVWDMGSLLAAIIAAEQLAIVNRREFDDWIDTLLSTLSDMPLYNNELPNTEYNLKTGMMIGSKGGTDGIGTGWSAKDIGRLLTWLHVLKVWYTDYDKPINKILSQWKFGRAQNNGQLHSAIIRNNEEYLYPESRLGYLQYAGLGYALWGYDMSQVMTVGKLDQVTLHAVELPHDSRENAYLTTDPFLLMQLESTSLSDDIMQIIDRVYRVHEAQWHDSGLLMAMGADALNQKPWFLYNTIFYMNKAWTCFSRPGEHHNNCQTLSTKTAFAWYANHDDDFTSALYQRASLLSNDDGYFTGVLSDGTINDTMDINTHAVILESMLFRKRGKMPFSQLPSASYLNTANN